MSFGHVDSSIPFFPQANSFSFFGSMILSINNVYNDWKSVKVCEKVLRNKVL